GITRTWPYLLTGALILHVLTLVSFARAYASLAAPGDESWWWKVLPFALSPPAATAAHLALTKPLLLRYHPIEVADSLCQDESFRGFALSEWRRIGFTQAPAMEGVSPDAAVEGPERRERQALQELIEARLGSDALSHLPPPGRSPGARSYCPRCHAQYIMRSGDCTDCVGVPLRPYDAVDAQECRGGTPRVAP
ncbi:MAG TPA: hypothetical protein VFV33_05005, partial [Gemmatimonadaceae bacterium]|nr:hypothetical protein [Gemmatimonadaceae bacterium]